MNLFDILGPVMVRPSSSCTAGVVRIGRMARTLLGDEPVDAANNYSVARRSVSGLAATPTGQAVKERLRQS